jgi:NADPH:quinone reductase-like Zn-dependent oxidoreductase
MSGKTHQTAAAVVPPQEVWGPIQAIRETAAVAVQLARWRGAQVIGTASAHNLGFVRSLGADQVIDYRATRFEDRVRDFDVVFDTVGGETLERSWGVLRPGGRLVTVATSGAGARDPRTLPTQTRGLHRPTANCTARDGGAP